MSEKLGFPTCFGQPKHFFMIPDTVNMEQYLSARLVITIKFSQTLQNQNFVSEF